MAQYKCAACGMGVKNLQCSTCNTQLRDNKINLSGQEVRVAECPEGHGKIKSPTCCGHDMMTV